MFDISTLSDYVEEKRLPLLAAAVLDANTLDYISLQTNVKKQAAVNIISVAPVIQAGGCNFTPQGDVTFSQRLIDAIPMKVNMTFCPDDLEAKWMNYEVRRTAGKETLPFEEVITSEITKMIAIQVDEMIWQGNQPLGVKGLLDFDSEYNDLGQIAGAKAAIEAVYMAIPAEKLSTAKIFVGEDTYRAYTAALVAANLYHYNGEYNNGHIFIPGTNVEVIAVAGLNGTAKIVAGDPKGMFWGVDFANDKEEFKLWYSDDDQIFRLAVKFNGGAQVAFPSEIVIAEVQ